MHAYARVCLLMQSHQLHVLRHTFQNGKLLHYTQHSVIVHQASELCMRATEVRIQIQIALDAGRLAGVKWEGSKTTFDDHQSNKSNNTPALVAQEAISQHVIINNPAQTNLVEDTGALQQPRPKMKWKKMATAELQQVSRDSDFFHV